MPSREGRSATFSAGHPLKYEDPSPLRSRPGDRWRPTQRPGGVRRARGPRRGVSIRENALAGRNAWREASAESACVNAHVARPLRSRTSAPARPRKQRWPGRSDAHGLPEVTFGRGASARALRTLLHAFSRAPQPALVATTGAAQRGGGGEREHGWSAPHSPPLYRSWRRRRRARTQTDVGGVVAAAQPARRSSPTPPAAGGPGLAAESGRPTNLPWPAVRRADKPGGDQEEGKGVGRGSRSLAPSPRSTHPVTTGPWACSCYFSEEALLKARQCCERNPATGVALPDRWCEVCLVIAIRSKRALESSVYNSARLLARHSAKGPVHSRGLSVRSPHSMMFSSKSGLNSRKRTVEEAPARPQEQYDDEDASPPTFRDVMLKVRPTTHW
eukprot:scaffold1106_cov608-Prasinococcus_capsulatus_cf.AAC.13